MINTPLKFKTNVAFQLLVAFLFVLTVALSVVSFKLKVPSLWGAPSSSNVLSLHVPSSVPAAQLDEALTTLNREFPYFSKIKRLDEQEMAKLLSIEGISNTSGLPYMVELFVRPVSLYNINYKELQDRIEELLPNSILEYQFFKQTIQGNNINAMLALFGAFCSLGLSFGGVFFAFRYEVGQYQQFLRLSLLLGSAPDYLQQIFNQVTKKYNGVNVFVATVFWGGAFIMDILSTAKGNKLYTAFGITLNVEDYLLALMLQCFAVWAGSKLMMSLVLSQKIRQQA